MIRIKGLWKSFGDNKVLKGVNLDIETGETIVVIGQSGCGKSVLMKTIVGLLIPDDGEIEIENVSLKNISRKKLLEIRKKIGMVFQSSALFDSFSVWENVGLGLIEHSKMSQDEIMRIAREKLKLVGLSDVEDMYPAELSGGMKKRVGIARAIAMNPQFVLYDEPTTGLDPIIADRINNLIIELQKELNITTVAVTHDIISAYKIADRIAMLYDGEIIFDGTPKEVQNTDNPYVQQFIKGEGEGPVSGGI
ncbi:MAG: ABC transporter ATP-binding protein [Candidatus Cloacimonadota bacterium]|nr:MAG: ABC transporter ATP-binding protein [Candidatus Cloacimonadota bacterium]